jgi:hypothetical protein
MKIPSWALENRFVLSLLVAGVVAAYGARALKESAEAGTPPASPRKPLVGAVARLFFVTFAATYVLSYVLERILPSRHGGFMRGGGVSTVGSPGLDVLLSHVDPLPPAF